MRFQGKVVTITGAAGGIGLETAKAFAREGAKVLLSDVDGEGLKRAVEEVAKLQPDARGITADVTRREDLVRLVEEARSSHGRLDVHVNNAGLAVCGPFDAISDEEMERHITVNLLGVMHGTRAAARIMRAQEGGHIVNIASLSGLSAVPGAAAYAASKFGVRGYTLTCALELRDTPVRVTVICPDAVETPLLVQAARDGSAPIIFSGKTLTPDRVARAILDVVENPRPEVCIPGHRGILCKIGALVPGWTDPIYPLFERLGRKTISRRPDKDAAP